jgi:hypothetical protein
VPFLDTDELAGRIHEALDRPQRFRTIRTRARQFVLDRFDAERICVPRMAELIHRSAD